MSESGFKSGLGYPRLHQGYYFQGSNLNNNFLKGKFPFNNEWVDGNIYIKHRHTLWTPNQISNLVGWFDSSDLETLEYDNDLYLDKWLDKSPENNHLVAGGTTPRCLLGYGVHTEQDGDYMISENKVQQNDEITYVSVFYLRDASYTFTGRLFSWSANGNNGFNIATAGYNTLFFTFGGNKEIRLNASDIGDIETTLVGSGIHIFSLSFSSPNQELIIRINGREEKRISTGTAPPVNEYFYNFNWSNAPSNNFRTMSGIKYEDIIINQLLSNPELEKLEGYLANKWNLKNKLIISHPYKRKPPTIESTPILFPNRNHSGNIKIVQDSFNVALDYAICYSYLTKTLQKMINDRDIFLQWFMNGVKVLGENEIFLELDRNNGDQNKNVYLEVTDFNNNIFTSNTITIQKVLWKPDQLSSLVLWLDASDSSTITDFSGNVSEWRDKSGLNAHRNQSDTTKRPSLDATGIYFDGVDEFLTGTTLDFGTSDFTLVCVIAYQGVDSAYPIGEGAGGNSSFGFGLGVNSGDKIYAALGDGTRLITSQIQVTHSTNIFIGEFDRNANYTPYFDGTTLSSNDISARTGSVGNNNCLIGSYDIGTTGLFKGYIFSVIAIKSLLSTSERQKLEGYLAHKWGITDKLPSNHPYKTTAP